MLSSLDVKVCVIGDTNVGKTSLSTRYCQGEMPESSSPTSKRNRRVYLNSRSSLSSIKLLCCRSCNIVGASFLQKRLTCSGIEINLQVRECVYNAIHIIGKE
jgi:GTPase SAR1 family protein